MIKIDIGELRKEFAKTEERLEEIEKKPWSKSDRADYLSFLHVCVMAAGDAYVDDRLSEKAMTTFIDDIYDIIKYRFGERNAEGFTSIVSLHRMARIMQNAEKMTKEPEVKGGLN